MRPLSIVLLLAVASCATRTGKVAGIVAGVSTGVGTLAIAAPCSDDECDVVDAANGVLFFGIAGIALVTALVAEAAASH